MKVKMISTRQCYIPSELREVGPNTEFKAADDREARRLERQKRATRVNESKPAAQPAAAPAPVARRRTLSLNADGGQANDKTLDTASGSYSRRDMRAEGE